MGWEGGDLSIGISTATPISTSTIIHNPGCCQIMMMILCIIIKLFYRSHFNLFILLTIIFISGPRSCQALDIMSWSEMLQVIVLYFSFVFVLFVFTFMFIFVFAPHYELVRKVAGNWFSVFICICISIHVYIHKFICVCKFVFVFQCSSWILLVLSILEGRFPH